MKKCYCLKTHDKYRISIIKKTFYENKIYYIFNKNECYHINELNVTDDLSELDAALTSFEYTTEEFNKYFTDEITVLRRLKLDKIKKVVQL